MYSYRLYGAIGLLDGTDEKEAGSPCRKLSVFFAAGSILPGRCGLQSF